MQCSSLVIVQFSGMFQLQMTFSRRERMRKHSNMSSKVRCLKMGVHLQTFYNYTHATDPEATTTMLSDNSVDFVCLFVCKLLKYQWHTV